MKIKEAVEILCKELHDPSYYIAWQANIAMAMKDAYDWEWDRLNANEGAKNFLDLLMK